MCISFGYKYYTSKIHSTPVGKMANFDHQNKFQKICGPERGYECGPNEPKIMNFGGPVPEIWQKYSNYAFYQF